MTSRRTMFIAAGAWLATAAPLTAQSGLTVHPLIATALIVSRKQRARGGVLTGTIGGRR